MASDNPPYVTAYGNIGKALLKVKAAQAPPRFTQDFLATKLGMKGGSARPLIPFLKRTGFLGSDGVPTERYRRFRNPGQSGAAAAEALREGYHSLYQINEYLHEASDDELLGVIVQATGLEPDSGTTRAIQGSFKALKDLATFDQVDPDKDDSVEEEEAVGDNSEAKRADSDGESVKIPKSLGLSYTINLNLPATSEIAVFDAIFRSLNAHLLK